jgi:hypothetical protein
VITWILFFRSTTRVVTAIEPVVITGNYIDFDTTQYQIWSTVHKINPDLTTSERTLKWIYYRDNWVRYYIEDCAMRDNQRYGHDDKLITTKEYTCINWEEVQYIWNTEKELKDSFCNK